MPLGCSSLLTALGELEHIVTMPQHHSRAQTMTRNTLSAIGEVDFLFKALTSLNTRALAGSSATSLVGTDSSSWVSSGTSSNEGGSISISPRDMSSIGFLVTVRCGHNGWPSVDALQSMLQGFYVAGIIDEATKQHAIEHHQYVALSKVRSSLGARQA